MLLPTFTLDDLQLINDLSRRKYENNSMSSNSTESEYSEFRKIKIEKLKVYATEFKSRFNDEYGTFEASISSGNPLSRSGKLNRLWSGIFKGSSNKQYAAQISFVMNPIEECLDLGFYFGRASSRGSKVDTVELEKRMQFLGKTLSNEIESDPKLYQRFQELFDNGFHAYLSGKEISPDEWLNQLKTNPKDTQVITKLYANAEGYIESSKVSSNISMIMFLMSLIPSAESNIIKRRIRPLTPEQRAEQAARRTIIGFKGELFVMDKEKERLTNQNISHKGFLVHVSLESDSFGYDIQSCDMNQNSIYIEVKTTTRIKSDSKSKYFFMSSNEYEFYLKNKDKYLLYRVYGIESDNPELEIIDLEKVRFKANDYVVEIIN